MKKLVDVPKTQADWINEFERVAGYEVNELMLERLLFGDITWKEFMDHEQKVYCDVVRENFNYIALLWANIMEDEGA